MEAQPARRKSGDSLNQLHLSHWACRHDRRKHPTQSRIDRIGGSQQGVVAQVSVPLSRLNLRVPKDVLHLVKRSASVN